MFSCYCNFPSVESRCKPETFTSDDILCLDPERFVPNKEKEVKQLSACSLITSYKLATNGTTRHKMLTSGTNSKGLKEYDGKIEVTVCYAIHKCEGKIFHRKGGVFIDKLELNH